MNRSVIQEIALQNREKGFQRMRFLALWHEYSLLLWCTVHEIPFSDTAYCCDRFLATGRVQWPTKTGRRSDEST